MSTTNTYNLYMAICDTTNTIKIYDRYFISGQNWTISRVTLLNILLTVK